MLTLYSRYRTQDTSFLNTLKLLQELLTERLNSDYTKIWVQGHSSGKTKLTFTVFQPNGNYILRFIEIGGFRLFRSDGDIENEIKLMEDLINRLRKNPLQDVI